MSYFFDTFLPQLEATNKGVLDLIHDLQKEDQNWIEGINADIQRYYKTGILEFQVNKGDNIQIEAVQSECVAGIERNVEDQVKDALSSKENEKPENSLPDTVTKEIFKPPTNTIKKPLRKKKETSLMLDESNSIKKSLRKKREPIDTTLDSKSIIDETVRCTRSRMAKKPIRTPDKTQIGPESKEVVAENSKTVVKPKKKLLAIMEETVTVNKEPKVEDVTFVVSKHKGILSETFDVPPTVAATTKQTSAMKGDPNLCIEEVFNDCISIPAKVVPVTDMLNLKINVPSSSSSDKKLEEVPVEEQKKKLEAKAKEKKEISKSVLEKEKKVASARKKQVPIYLRQEMPLLPTYDCYDSDDEEKKKIKVKKPSWELNFKITLKIQSCIQNKYRNSLFSLSAQSPDLVELFNRNELKKMKRTSSAIWHKAPNFSFVSNDIIEEE